MPAEWEPHHATWIGWPHNASDWPGKLGAIQWAYAEIVRRIAPGEVVRILVNSAAHEARARRVLDRAGVGPDRTEFFRFPTNRGWTRDFGPCFVRRDHSAAVAVLRFHFNGWAKYSDWKKDDQIAERVARRLKLSVFPARVGRRPLVLEGGSIDVNGQGSVLTTEECLLDAAVQVRNPGLERPALEAALRGLLGVSQVVWLGRGIAGDDTHGHVDDVCRFVGPSTVVLCRESDSRDANHGALEENRERLEGLRLENGSKIEVVPLPMPGPVCFGGRRLPASYANFYIANAAVLVPTFNDPNDRVALGVLGELFRDRPVIGIHAVDLVWGLGTIHCLTQQQPQGSGSPAVRPPREAA
jgi:agmatine deiminase